MEHEKQVEVIKQALELETQIQVLEQFLPEERAETYAGAPAAGAAGGPLHRAAYPARLQGQLAADAGACRDHAGPLHLQQQCFFDVDVRADAVCLGTCVLLRSLPQAEGNDHRENPQFRRIPTAVHGRPYGHKPAAAGV